jgi:hypothetical protein
MVSNSGGSDTKTSNSYITVNPSPAASVSSTDASCNSACDGSGSLIASGGTTPYTYYWNTNPTQNNATSTGLCAGTYNYSVSGANGCNSTGTVTIAEPSAISLSLTTTDAACGTADGTASVSAAGGSAPFSYQWDDPANQNTSTATGLTAGIYSVTVTDANGCSTSSSISVDNQGGPSISTTSQDVICNGDTHGQATVIPTGGTPPYTYSWNTTTPQVTATATGLAAGTYSIIVTDASGCIVSDFVTISEPAALNLAMAYTNVSGPSFCDGSATATVTGGTPPYGYLWDDPLLQATQTAVGLCIGTYTVMVTDGNGCTSNGSIYVDSLVMGIANPNLENQLTIYPNPTNGNLTIEINGNQNEATAIEIYSLTGKMITDLKFRYNTSNKITIDLTRQPIGLYFVRIITQNEIVTKKVTLIGH